MPLVQVLPPIAAAAFVAFAVTVAASGTASLKKRMWMFPATLSALFLAWSASAALVEGPVGFWVEHTRNMWGNQIWFDLLLAVGIGWYLVLPQAKALGMRTYPWLAVVACTGSIGFLAMIARLLYLKEHAGESR